MKVTLKSLWICLTVCGAIVLAKALPNTPVLPAAPTGTRYIFVTNYVYVYPKATNWVNVTNYFSGSIDRVFIDHLYIPKTWLTN